MQDGQRVPFERKTTLPHADNAVLPADRAKRRSGGPSRARL